MLTYTFTDMPTQSQCARLQTLQKERKFCCLFLESPLINYNYQPEDLLVWLDNLSSLTLLSFSLTHTLTHTHTHSHTY